MIMVANDELAHLLRFYQQTSDAAVLESSPYVFLPRMNGRRSNTNKTKSFEQIWDWPNSPHSPKKRKLS